MTLFQHVSIWALRALVLWGAVEVGAAAYGEATTQLEKFAEISGHEAAMQRLEARAQEKERALRREQAKLAALERIVWTAPPQRAPGAAPATPIAAPAGRTDPIAQALRADLMELGASEVMLEASEAPLSGGLTRIVIDARWREAAAMSPSILDRLAARRANIALLEFTMELQQGTQLVQANAKFEVIARAERRRAR